MSYMKSLFWTLVMVSACACTGGGAGGGRASGSDGTGGLCADPAGCAPACGDTLTDEGNCGSCGVACPAGATCLEGRCQCPPLYQDCAGTCVDPRSDAAHCGACGIRCGAGGCNEGVCVAGAGGAGSGGAGSGGVGPTPNACPATPADAYQGTPAAIPGTIEAEDFDPEGYFDSSPGNEGSAYRLDADVDIKSLGDGYVVGWVTAGEWLEYTVNVATAGDYNLVLRGGAVEPGRTLVVEACGATLATLPVPVIGDWGEVAATTAVPVHLTAGVQVLRLTAGALDFLDLDSLRFELAATGVGGAGNDPDTLYVSPTGDDANPGTLAEPFRTLTRARDAVRTLNTAMTSDLHVVLRGGTYRFTETLTFSPVDSGTNGYRVHYEAYPGETPVLSGATRVTGFTPHGGGIYKAPLARTKKLRNLYVNDARASLTSRRVTARGGYGTYTVTAGQATWAWASGTNSDGVLYDSAEVPSIASNRDDLEIVNGTTWNENIVCVRDVITTGSNQRALLLQQPYGAISQLPGWGTAFVPTGQHTLFNAFEFLSEPGQYYFDKTTQTLYYYPRPGEDMATADVEAPVVEKLIEIAGTSQANRVRNLTFRGLTLAHTDFDLFAVGDSHGKATCQGATAYTAYRDSDWHKNSYEIIDTNPGLFTISGAESIELLDSVVKHSGSDGIAMTNDVVGARLVGNYITDIAASGVTIGHPQHVYIGDGGARAKYSPEVEGVCSGITVSNNVLYNISTQPGFGGCAGITAFFVDTVSITHNHVQQTAYNGIHLGWGWRNYKDSTTCHDNEVSNNRLIDTLSRLHDSGAIYTIGQMPGTTINENYVRGIPPATSGPTYGLHNDEGSAYLTENDNVLDIDPGVKYTINCEDFGEKHDLTILRTYATVNKMGVNPPASIIDPPVAVPDNVWPLAQYTTAVRSGVDDAYRHLLPPGLLDEADYVFPASAAAAGGELVTIRRASAATHAVWFAPSGTTVFTSGASMTRAAGDATSIAAPTAAGTYKLFVLDGSGTRLGESAALLRVR